MEEAVMKHEKSGQTYVVLPALEGRKPVALFDDGSYCRDWMPRDSPVREKAA